MFLGFSCVANDGVVLFLPLDSIESNTLLHPGKFDGLMGIGQSSLAQREAVISEMKHLIAAPAPGEVALRLKFEKTVENHRLNDDMPRG